MAKETEPITYRVSPEVDAELKKLAQVHGGIDRALRALLGKKLSKEDRLKAELAASDLTAQVVEREDIEYGHHESIPRGEHVANSRFAGPLLKPGARKKAEK
jgi:hypothetical protein